MSLVREAQHLQYMFPFEHLGAADIKKQCSGVERAMSETSPEKSVRSYSLDIHDATGDQC